MRIHDLEFIKLLPVFMRKDPAVQALAQVMTDTLADPDDHLKGASTWNRIDILTDAELDELAWEFDIDWYDYSASHEIKVSQIKNALLIKKKRGTNWSVTQILADIWGWAYVREWYEFGGEPYTFEVVVKDQITTQEMFDKLIALIDKAKNVRSRLIRVYYSEEHEIVIELGKAIHDGTFKLPLCNQHVPGGFKVLGTVIDCPKQYTVTGNFRGGIYTMPQCAAYLCGYGPKPPDINTNYTAAYKLAVNRQTDTYLMSECGSFECEEDKK